MMNTISRALKTPSSYFVAKQMEVAVTQSAILILLSFKMNGGNNLFAKWKGTELIVEKHEG